MTRCDLSEKEPVLDLRSRTLQAVRRFFVDRGFLEVETPVRIPAPASEAHIDAEPAGEAFLRTSPELHMKRLLAAGYDRVFQLGPCFRRGERGRQHHPEFTMLEWYRAEADYRDAMADTKALLASVLKEVHGGVLGFDYGGRRIDLLPVWECFTVREAFLRFAGWDPVKAFDADRFDVDLVSKVETQFPPDRPVVLKDYPVQRAALARCRVDDPPVAERWELYIGGMELANAFSELTDVDEQRRRFVECADGRRREGRDVYPMDEDFLDALEAGLPSCTGVALGVDRLVMLLADRPDIQDVTAFSH